MLLALKIILFTISSYLITFPLALSLLSVNKKTIEPKKAYKWIFISGICLLALTIILCIVT